MTKVRICAAVALLAAAQFSLLNGGAAATEFATLARTGDVAPGTGGLTFTSVSRPVVNGGGTVAFDADLSSGDDSIWVADRNGLALLARDGQQAPGTPAGVTFDGVFSPRINAASHVAFNGRVAGPGVGPSNERGVWLGMPGAVTLVGRQGDAAPGAGAGVNFTFFQNFVLNNADQIAFQGGLSDGGGGIWVGGPGTLAKVARNGDPAPGAGGGVTFTGLGDTFLNGLGEVVFQGFLSDAGQGIWFGRPGAISLVARNGDLAPGAGGLTFDSFFSSFSLNGAGQVVIDASLSDGSTGIWLGRPGDLALVARQDDVAPGAGGAIFTGFGGTPVLNGAGELAFRASINDGRSGIWIRQTGGLNPVIFTGDPAPGLGGLTFDSFGELSFNGAGELAFEADVAGGGVTNQNDEGVWAGRPDSLQLVVREGDSIEVAPGVFETVDDGVPQRESRSGNEDGRRSGFSEGGQLALEARFLSGERGILLSPPDRPSVHRSPYRAVDGVWDKIVLPSSFKRPVIIAGPATRANREPGVVRLRNVDGAKAYLEARFQEWRYLDGQHPEERVDFLSLEQGRHRQADGSIWEAGRVRVSGNRDWKSKRFRRRFPGVPRVFVTVQTFRGRAPVAARVRNVTREGFEVSIQEEERDLGSRHPREVVGFLAVFSTNRQGTIVGGVEGSDYRLRGARVTHRFRRVLGIRTKLEEERSLDRERRHDRERVSAMTLGRGFFAQQASDNEVDTTAIRRR